MIHISFDLWTASNNLAYIEVIAHFTDAKKELCTVVITVHDIHGIQSGKIYPKVIIPMIDKYPLKKKLSYFITDNAFFNDTFVIKIIDRIWLDLNIGKQRLWYMRNIINLIAKSFIFDNKSETCETDIAIAKNTNNNLEAARKL